MSKYVPVASCAEEPSDCPRGVTVIHRQPLSSSVSSAAYVAETTLVLVDTPIFVLCDPVGFVDPLGPRDSRTGSPFGPVVGSTTWPRVGCLSFGGDSFVTAVDARLPSSGNVVRREPAPPRRQLKAPEQCVGQQTGDPQHDEEREHDLDAVHRMNHFNGRSR